jgi:hypothetical protein
LAAITLEVNGSKTAAMMAYPIDFEQPGTAQLAYQGTMSVLVNGVTYSFDVTAPEQDLTITGFNQFTGGDGVLTASGSGVFTIDPSLFASFISPADCGLPGICVTGSPNGGSDYLAGFVHNVSNANLLESDADVKATFTLIYSFIPLGASSVPEPATWMMMLLGFGLIGRRLSRMRRSVQRRDGVGWRNYRATTVS